MENRMGRADLQTKKRTTTMTSWECCLPRNPHRKEREREAAAAWTERSWHLAAEWLLLAMAAGALHPQPARRRRTQRGHPNARVVVADEVQVLPSGPKHVLALVGYCSDRCS
jgi:hypothetical protein